MTRLGALLLALILALVATPWVDAQKTVHVKPYTRKDGTPVKGHDRRASTKKGATPTSKTASVATEDAPAKSSESTDESLSGPSSQLLGFSAAEVREALGAPALNSNGLWNYDNGRQTLHL